MAAVWREDEDSHATLLALLCYLCGQMQIVFVYHQNYWSPFPRPGMFCEVLYISRKMILRFLSG